MIKEYKVNLTEDQEHFIKWVVGGEDFPLYSAFSDGNIFYDGNINPIFGHTLRKRVADKGDEWGEPNSDFTDIFENIFMDFCKEHDIKCNRILRSGVNFTTHQPSDSEYFIHRDHDFSHKNMVVYLTDCNGGPTMVRGKKDFYGKEDEVYIFEGLHQMKAPTSNRRIVLVYTFI